MSTYISHRHQLKTPSTAIFEVDKDCWRHRILCAENIQINQAFLLSKQMPIKINFQEKFEPNVPKVPITQRGALWAYLSKMYVNADGYLTVISTWNGFVSLSVPSRSKMRAEIKLTRLVPAFVT